MNRRIMQLEIEEAALKKESDKLSQDRLVDLQKELSELRDEYNTRKASWDNEKKLVEDVAKIKEELDDVQGQIKIAQQKYDLEEAAKLQYGKLPELQTKLEEAEEKLKTRESSFARVRWQKKLSQAFYLASTILVSPRKKQSK